MRILTGWLGRGISFVLFHSPVGLRRGLANILAFLWFDLFRIRRQTALDNIQIAFPEMSLQERVILGRKSLRHLALNFIEYSFLPWLTHENYQKHFVFVNAHLMDEALREGKGVLMLTGHIGHGDLACAAMSLHGWKIVLISKFFKFKWLNDMWFGMRERAGTRFIPPRDSSFALLKALKTNSAVIIPLDQFTGPPIGVETRFFGKTTGTAAGLAVMAGRSEAPVLAVYTIRDPQGRHVLNWVRRLPVEKSRDPVAIQRMTQSFNDELEKYVRLYPEQWMWIHRRWKTFEVG